MEIGFFISIGLCIISIFLILIQLICRFLKKSIGVRLFLGLYSLAFIVLSACVFIFTVSHFANTQQYKSTLTKIDIKTTSIDKSVSTKDNHYITYTLYNSSGDSIQAIKHNKTRVIKDNRKYAIIDGREYTNPYPQYIPQKLWKFFSKDTIPYIKEIHF